jgi:predicted ester cyclase
MDSWNETVEQVIAEGDLVVTRFTSRGTFEGEPSHGKKVTVSEIAIHRIADGRIGTLGAPQDEPAGER